jgi:hypothetical protein
VANSTYDEPGVAVRIPSFPKANHGVLQTQLRTACIEMLCTAMASGRVALLAQPPAPVLPPGATEAAPVPMSKLRQEVIGMLFKSLTCRTPEIVAASKAGLQQVISQQKLPKELLQQSLRPILGPICANHKHLSLPLLQGLARLLELLSNWFNVTLGEKLIDHLNKWLEPEKLLQASHVPLTLALPQPLSLSPRTPPPPPLSLSLSLISVPPRLQARNSWKPGEEAKIADSLINLFHLLPSMAIKFLDDLVQLTIKLEDVLPIVGTNSPLCSPYQASVARYLCVYKAQAIEYFLIPERLAANPYYFRFVSMLKSEVGIPLREELAAHPHLLVAATLGETTWLAAEKAAEARKAADGLLPKVAEIERRMEEKRAKDDKAKAEKAAEAAKAEAAKGSKADADKKGASAVKEAPALVKEHKPEPKDVKELESATAELGTATAALTDAVEALTAALGTAPVVQYQGVYLITLLAKLTPGWLSAHAPVVELLRAKWGSPARRAALAREEHLPRLELLESKRLVKCFLLLLREDHSLLEVLFELLCVFTTPTCVDFTFLKDFLTEEVAKRYSPAERSALLNRFLRLFHATFASVPTPGLQVAAAGPAGGPQQEGLVVAMQLLVIPMLTDTLRKPFAREVIDEPMVLRIVRDLIGPLDEVAAAFEEPLRIELLQLATLMIRHMPKELQSHRKELIKFGWNHLKHEDTSSKQWAFVNVCYFLDAYQSPDKIILQVFVALLRTCQPEARTLVRDALNILVPALPRRLPLTEGWRTPTWIRYARKVRVWFPCPFPPPCWWPPSQRSTATSSSQLLSAVHPVSTHTQRESLRGCV